MGDGLIIENSAQVDRLLSKLRASLPIAAKITPELSATDRKAIRVTVTLPRFALVTETTSIVL